MDNRAREDIMTSPTMPLRDPALRRRAPFRLVPVLLLAGFSVAAVLSGCSTENGDATAKEDEAQEERSEEHTV